MSTTSINYPSKTYTPLAEVATGNGPGQTKIVNCSEVLPNHMQCWRAGDFLVTVENEPTANADGTLTPNVTRYQKCRAHAQFEQERDAAAATAAQALANDQAQLAAAQAAAGQ